MRSSITITTHGSAAARLSHPPPPPTTRFFYVTLFKDTNIGITKRAVVTSDSTIRPFITISSMLTISYFSPSVTPSVFAGTSNAKFRPCTPTRRSFATIMIIWVSTIICFQPCVPHIPLT